jgi:hypothetical protein
MKPDWKDAPEWANWLAMDSDGDWYWFEDQQRDANTVWVGPGRVLFAGKQGNDWRSTQTKRPETTKPAEAGSEGQGA